jgi:hypothetical protein
MTRPDASSRMIKSAKDEHAKRRNHSTAGAERLSAVQRGIQQPALEHAHRRFIVACFS